MKYTFILFALVVTNIYAGNSEGGKHGRPPGMTDAQDACIKKILGEPGSGERPSKEKMDAAMTSCGVEKPKGGPPSDSSNSSSGSQTETSAQ